MELVSATVRLMAQRKLILLIPITMVSGLEQAFMQGDFTKVYKHLKKENSHYEGSQFQI